tara:strand:- start:234 stop:632 length:399 start_codon:yes stop_codon:yes gene_type:complete
MYIAKSNGVVSGTVWLNVVASLPCTSAVAAVAAVPAGAAFPLRSLVRVVVSIQTPMPLFLFGSFDNPIVRHQSTTALENQMQHGVSFPPHAVPGTCAVSKQKVHVPKGRGAGTPKQLLLPANKTTGTPLQTS